MAQPNDMASISFKPLIDLFNQNAQDVAKLLSDIAKDPNVTPAMFLGIQQKVNQLSQLGDSISNVMSQLQAMINVSVRNQKT